MSGQVHEALRATAVYHRCTHRNHTRVQRQESIMLAVTCFQCGHTVEISPDADRCALCGANLRRLIDVRSASRYFYTRAAELSARGDVGAALHEVRRGLAYQPTSELHLLGAILCKRMGRLDEMRRHVAAIPVDDVLRGEAEWLLRSSQARRRVAAGARAEEESLLSDDELLPLSMDEVRPTSHSVQRRSGTRTAAFIVGLAAVGVVGWGFWQASSDWAARLGFQPTPTLQTSIGVDGAQGAPAQQIAPPETLQETPAPENSPTPFVSPYLADAAREPLAATSPEALLAGAAFDLKTILIEAQRPELAETVTGRLEGGRLVLEGTVPSVEEREALVALLELLPTVEEVSAVNVRVRPPATYTVQEGDTLWDISMKLYGTPARVQALFEANRDVLLSPDALRVGMVLKTPPME